MIALRAIAVNVARPAAFRMQRPARPFRRSAMPLYVPAGASPRPQARKQMAWLPTAIFSLKLVASGLAGATITLAMWPSDRQPVVPQTIEAGRAANAAAPRHNVVAPRQESSVHRSAPQPAPEIERDRAREIALLKA